MLGFDKFGPDGFLAAAGTGWIRYDPTAIELSTAVENVPDYWGLILGPAHKPGLRTSEPYVDGVLELLEARDLQGLLSIAPSPPYEYVPPGQFGPICAEGTAVGTMVTAFATAACHGEFYESAEGPLASLLKRMREPVRVFAIYDLGTDGHLVVLASAQAILVSGDGLITTLRRSCGPETLLPRADVAFLVPPLTPPLLTTN